jgi:hypothetical protein
MLDQLVRCTVLGCALYNWGTPHEFIIILDRDNKAAFIRHELLGWGA